MWCVSRGKMGHLASWWLPRHNTHAVLPFTAFMHAVTLCNGDANVYLLDFLIRATFFFTLRANAGAASGSGQKCRGL